MKKSYISPNADILDVELALPLNVSLSDNPADPNTPVDSKRRNALDDLLDDDDSDENIWQFVSSTHTILLEAYQSICLFQLVLW